MTKKFRQRKIKFDIEPYGRKLEVVVTNDILLAYKKHAISRLTEKGPTASTNAFVWTRKGCNQLFMFLPERASVNTIAHESFHVVYFALDLSSVPCTDDTEEAWAYLQGFVTGKVSDFLKGKK